MENSRKVNYKASTLNKPYVTRLAHDVFIDRHQLADEVGHHSSNVGSDATSIENWDTEVWREGDEGRGIIDKRGVGN